MNFFKHLFAATTRGWERPATPPNNNDDLYVRACFEVNFAEKEDMRWFTQFPELKTFDDLRSQKAWAEALEVALRGVAGYPDSFLFYCRAAECYDALGQAARAEETLMDGLAQALSTVPLGCALAERAFKKGDYPEAVKWWVRACIVQSDSGIFRDGMPFLNLACVALQLNLADAGSYLLEMADRASSIGPVRLDAAGTNLRREAANSLTRNGNKAVRQVLVELSRKYKP